jgi:hypothetical protein
MTQKQIEARKRLKQMFSTISGMGTKLTEAKKEYRKRKKAEDHRRYYREANGIPLDAPVMTLAESIKLARKARWKKKDTQP